MNFGRFSLLACVLALGLLLGCSERNAEQEYAVILGKEMSGGDPATLTNQYQELISRYSDTETAIRARERLIALRDKLEGQHARAELKAEIEAKQTQSRIDLEKAEVQLKAEQEQREAQFKADIDATVRQFKTDIEASQRELAAQVDRKIREAQPAQPSESTEPKGSVGTSPASWGIGGKSGQPAYMQNPPPPYPREALERRWQGTTLLRVEVLADGAAGSIEIAKSSGHSNLDEAATEAVRHWKFLPARSGGAALGSTVEIPVTFRLTE